nr:hypothetical protein [uncultured bacterium]AQS30206.1 hypothetical protein [uncultured bacterium]
MRKNSFMALVAFVVVSLFVLVGCGGGGSKSPTTPPANNNGNNLPAPSVPSGIDQTSYRAEVEVPTSPDSGEGALVLRHGVYFFSPDASDNNWTFGVRTWVKSKDGNPFQLDTYRWSGKDGMLNLANPSQDKSSVVVRVVTIGDKDISPAVGVYTVGIKTADVSKGKLVPLAYSVNTPPYALWVAWLKFGGLYHTNDGGTGGGSSDGDPADSWLEELWGNINEWICPSSTVTVTLAIDDELWVWDETGDSPRWAYNPQTPEPPNVPPTVILEANPTSGVAPLTVNFDASGSSDSDGTIIEYAWDFTSDQATDQEGIAVSYTYTNPGTYLSTLYVTDNDGVSRSKSVAITVAESQNPPTTWGGEEFNPNLANFFTDQGSYVGLSIEKEEFQIFIPYLMYSGMNIPISSAPKSWTVDWVILLEGESVKSFVDPSPRINAVELEQKSYTLRAQVHFATLPNPTVKQYDVCVVTVGP